MPPKTDPNAEKQFMIKEMSDKLYAYITKKMDVNSNTSILKVQRDLNNIGQLVYGAESAGLSEDGQYGKKTIRRLNGFKENYENSSDNMIRLMVERMGPDFMFNPENSPKLPNYRDPKTMEYKDTR